MTISMNLDTASFVDKIILRYELFNPDWFPSVVIKKLKQLRKNKTYLQNLNSYEKFFL